MLRLAARLSKILGPGRPRRDRPSRRRPGRRFACESLEPRELLTGLGTDYTLMGGQWNNAQTITYSIPPDGVTWDQGINNVNAVLDAEYGGTSWQGLVARALQTWASVTNLNFTQVADGPYPFNAPGVNQGDPDFGDIRIGGFNFNTTATIAQTYGPPPNGQTGAGDVKLNTGFNFSPGSSYDLETIFLHELGHSLGLGESPQPSSVMYSNYEGTRQLLSPYDIEGIQSLYGARQPDSYQAAGVATSASTALDLTPGLNAYGQGQLGGLGLQTIGDVEYFSVVAPAVTGATLDVAAIAQGVSLLSPKVSIIDPTIGATLATAANPNAYGDIALGSASGIQPGHRYLIEVTGATGDVFSVGSYGIELGFFDGTPVAPSPDPYSYNTTFANPTELGANTQPTIGNLTLPSASNYQLFSFETTRSGPVMIVTLGADVVVVNTFGQVVVEGTGVLGFQAPGAGRYFLVMVSPNNAPVANYAFAVRTPGVTPAVASPSFSPPSLSQVSTTVEVESTDASPITSNAVVAPTASPTVNLRKPTLVSQ
jgi:Matrixin